MTESKMMLKVELVFKDQFDNQIIHIGSDNVTMESLEDDLEIIIATTRSVVKAMDGLGEAHVRLDCGSGSN